jgi:SagB-type dehydrogenase family enzyme
MLKTCAGVRETPGEDGPLRRWAATAGNLGSVELYVVSRRIEGLPTGVYFYQPREHSLAMLKQDVGGGLDPDEFVRRAMFIKEEQLPDAVIILTGALHRVGRKYGPFGYRLIQLDAGASLSQLLMVANGLGLGAQAATAWADDLIEDHLDLERFNEQVTGAIEIGRSVRRGHEREAGVEQAASSRPAQEYQDLSLFSILNSLYHESRITECTGAPKIHAVPLELSIGIHASDGRTVLLSPAKRGADSLDKILADRRTVRQYSAQPISLQKLGAMLYAANDGAVANDLLTLLVLAMRVEGLEAGGWIYDPNRHALEFWKPAPGRVEMEELFVQPEFAAAPVHVWIIGNLAAACSRYGAWGHRNLLVQAGAAAHRVWFGAMGKGLKGAIVAGLAPGRTRLHLGLDGYTRAAIAGVAAGVA